MLPIGMSGEDRYMRDYQFLKSMGGSSTIPLSGGMLQALISANHHEVFRALVLSHLVLDLVRRLVILRSKPIESFDFSDELHHKADEGICVSASGEERVPL